MNSFIYLPYKHTMNAFSDRCKELLIGAEKLARVSNNLYIYPEHLALTIFSNPS